MTKVKDIVERLRQDFPEGIASKGDPVGMQIGSMDADVTKVMTTLDVRPQVVEEAVKKGINFIVSHHPVMFRPARNLNFANAQNAMYGEIIKNGITVYSIHTNSDKAQNGSADWQAEELGLKDVEPFCLDDDGIAMGRKGKLPKTMSAYDFAYYVKDKMNIKMARLITADNEKQISTEIGKYIYEIANKIHSKGGNVYLVGGAIRDKLLGIVNHDEDYCVTGISFIIFFK